MKRVLAVLTTLVFGLVLAACGGDNEIKPVKLNMLNPVTYENADCGLQFYVPGDWQQLAEDSYNVSFASADGSVSLTARLELGGMSYFSNTELADLAAQISQDNLEQAEVYQQTEYTYFDAAGLGTAVGTVPVSPEQEVNAVCETLVVQYKPAIRCYITVLTDPDNYQLYHSALDEIYQSVQVTRSEDELYAQLEDLQAEYQSQHTDAADEPVDNTGVAE